MNKLFSLADQILKSPVTQFLIAVMLIYGGTSEIREDYQKAQHAISVHHGIALYGIIMIIRAGIALVKAIAGFGKVHAAVTNKKSPPDREA
jgi:hypothetical protein